MSDLTQRAEGWVNNEDPNLHSSEAQLIRDLSAALVQAEQEKMQIETQRQGLFIQVRDADDSLKAFGWPAKGNDHATRVSDSLLHSRELEARLASQEATIRQVAQEMRDFTVCGASFYEVLQWADTLESGVKT